MKYHHRLIEDRLVRLASCFPIVVVSGARQVGKSTLLRHLFESRARIFVFDPVTDVGNARRDPELFLRLNPPPLVFDEVQHAPELLPVLKLSPTTETRRFSLVDGGSGAASSSIILLEKGLPKSV